MLSCMGNQMRNESKVELSDIVQIRTLDERLNASYAGIIPGAFNHDCQDDDIIDIGSSQECKVCGYWVDDPNG